MSKLAIVLCASVFALATNGAFGSDVAIAQRQAKQAIDDALVLSDPKYIRSDPHQIVNNKVEVFAASLWKDVREFLANKDIDEEAKTKLNNLVSEVLDYLGTNLREAEREFDRCASDTKGEPHSVTCFNVVAHNAYEAATKRFPDLNSEVHKLAEADCKKKCERPHSVVPIFVSPEP